MARAISSFPVPVSPRISTVESVAATLSTAFKTFRRDGADPTISSNIEECVSAVSRPLFDSLAIIDVGSRRIPAHQMSLFVAERVVTDEEPAILTVVPARPLFDFKRQAASQRRLALLAQPLEMFT